MKIPFNKPWFGAAEMHNISGAASFGHLSGNGVYTQKSQAFMEERYGFKKTFLTTSCTDALEMAAMLMDVRAGDEIIMPSYTFVSTTNPFVLKGMNIVFADSLPDHPNIDLNKVEALITEKTKVLMVMHYGGVACDMDQAVAIANKHKLILIEDVAHAIDASFKGKALGTFGHFSVFSFHETKNISCGEGGMLAINDRQYIPRAEVVWEKGTNRTAFSRGEVSKYEWVDVGASFLPSELIAAVLYAQLNQLDDIQKKRIMIWERYDKNLRPLQQQGKIELLHLPDFATNNGHLFYLLLSSEAERNELLQYLNEHMVQAVFHYLPLHSSPYYKDKHDGRELIHADRFASTLLRLPLFYELPLEVVDMICERLRAYFS